MAVVGFFAAGRCGGDRPLGNIELKALVVALGFLATTATIVAATVRSPFGNIEQSVVVAICCYFFDGFTGLFGNK